MATVEFQSVSKRYQPGTPMAVIDLNLVCQEGEMLALLGPSGCGKSSTLKMAAGLEELTEGEILFGGVPVSRLPAGQRNIAMVFEDYCLYPNLTIAENIDFPLSVRGYSKTVRKERVDEVLAMLGLTDMADRKVHDLSGGAQQRIAIGRAVVRDPALILFDEPLSHLDGEQKIHLRAEISRLQKSRGVTSILVTHDQTEATAMADRIAIMRGGVLQQVAPPSRLYERPANIFVANFIGEPPMNLFPASVSAVAGHIDVPILAATIAVGDERRRMLEARQTRDLVVGLRPEHLIVETVSADRSVNAIIRYREPRGDADSLVLEILNRSGDTLVAELPGPTLFRAGDGVHLRIPAERMHLFDADTEFNLELDK
jgi:ABC-type sugar transport system ATPase subunit